jgi:pimeloyl-ACP methyl ester carboxylesterase
MDPLEYPHPSISGYVQKHPPTKTITITASDGIQTSMQLWIPPTSIHGKQILLIPGASVDYQIFALPTIPLNFVDYLVEHGYTVFCVNHRVTKCPAAKDNWTTFDARLDIAAAVDTILKETKAEKIYAVVHCAGAIATAAGLLDGTIKGIGGLTVSQVFMHPVFAEINMLKANLEPSLPGIYQREYSDWFEVVGGNDRAFMDEILRAYPVGGPSEICRSIVCHRSELVFGRFYTLQLALIYRLWSHKGLNESTHHNLASFVGGVSMKNLQQLMFMGSNNYIVDNEMTSLLTPENLWRLEDIPILFIHGGQNAVYNPRSTEMDYDTLRETFGATNYKRYVFEEKGHLDCWMGKASFRDLYPRVEEHASQIAREPSFRPTIQIGLDG